MQTVSDLDAMLAPWRRIVEKCLGNMKTSSRSLVFAEESVTEVFADRILMELVLIRSEKIKAARKAVGDHAMVALAKTFTSSELRAIISDVTIMCESAFVAKVGRNTTQRSRILDRITTKLYCSSIATWYEYVETTQTSKLLN